MCVFLLGKIVFTLSLYVKEAAGGSLYLLETVLLGHPGGPVAETPHSQCRGPRFNPWSGN